jgi:nitrite reductase/ring-hydroxylating ferredoxin subunit
MATSTRNTTRYGGYYKKPADSHDPELTETGPGTPMGEYMRRFWHPVCLSEELSDVPKAIRILGEDLVAFRDREERVGVLHRQCSHRGTSLEFGIVQQRGIRCCYHGWVYDIDGTLLEAPAEPKDSHLFQTVCQGAYHAFERDGLVFAYMGPPDEVPAFPEFDAYERPAGNRLVAFSNIYPCNWLQVYENIMDHMHTALLHNNMTVDSVDASVRDGLNFPDAFQDMPIMSWEATRKGQGCTFIAGRRIDDATIWVRMSEMVFPHQIHVSNLNSSAGEDRHTTVCLTRWHTPVDDENCILFGWRHFNDEIDPRGDGDESRCGYDMIDFLEGQVERPYDVGQRAPGDWDAITHQRKIAVHSMENPGTSDVGVYLSRKLLREQVRGKVSPANDGDAKALHTHSSDTTLKLVRHPDPDADKAQIRAAGKKIYQVLVDASTQNADERSAFIRTRLAALDDDLPTAAE